MSKIDFKKFLSVFIKEADDDKDFMSAIKKALNDQGFIYDGEKIKKFKVVKGTCYKCIKDVVMSDGTSEKMELIDRTLRNRAKQDKKEKHVWEDGDIVRLKEDNGKRWRITKLEDGVLYRDAWVFSEMSEKYIAGGVIYTSGLDSEYEFVSNPTKDAEEVLEKSISEIDKMVPSYLEGYTDGLKKGKTELLDNFNQNKIDNMVHHFKNTKENFLDKRVSDIYRKGITDTLEKLRKETQ
jgi:uncharacterized membrane-anchored protein YjiN (DUF445 family)